MITLPDFRFRFPEFGDVALYPDGRIQMVLDEAVILMADEPKWLDWYVLAQYQLVAHLLTIYSSSESGDAGSMFPTKRQEVDDVIVENAVSDFAADTSLIHSTIYGQRYYTYLRLTFTGLYGV